MSFFSSLVGCLKCSFCIVLFRSLGSIHTLGCQLFFSSITRELTHSVGSSNFSITVQFIFHLAFEEQMVPCGVDEWLVANCYLLWLCVLLKGGQNPGTEDCILSSNHQRQCHHQFSQQALLIRFSLSQAYKPIMGCTSFGTTMNFNGCSLSLCVTFTMHFPLKGISAPEYPLPFTLVACILGFT